MSNNEQEAAVGVECRICHSKTTRDLILSPCLCKGSLAYVHFRCLERWLNFSGRSSCELCSSRFNTVQRRRYGCLQSIRMWASHPVNRAFILCDMAIGLALTFLTITLIIICCIGLTYFVEGAEGVPTFLSTGVINIVLVVLVAGYMATMYSMLRDHVIPWYAWWTHCVTVKLVVDKTSLLLVTPGDDIEAVVSNRCTSCGKHELPYSTSTPGSLRRVNSRTNQVFTKQEVEGPTADGGSECEPKYSNNKEGYIVRNFGCSNALYNSESHREFST